MANLRKLVFLKVIILSMLLLVGCAGIGHAPTASVASDVLRPAVPENVHNVALLLPLSGNLADSSMAIRNGFLAAYYSQTATQPGVKVKVVNSDGKNIVDVYKDAVAMGADVVVGPLTKAEVGALASVGTPLQVPVLALNTLDDYQSHQVANLYQFGLLPQDEARQAALKMLQSGHRKIATIAPDTAWGHGIINALQNEIARLGGQVVATFTYNVGESDLDLKIRGFLDVNNSDLKQQDSQNRQINYRNDIDAIFLVAEPKVARQIAPLLKFYTNGSMPLYATSSIYSGFVQSALDQDLDDVMFCDAPLVITNQADLDVNLQGIRNKLGTLWPDSMKNNTRLYALGIDAYNLALNLNKFVTTKHASFAGATGELNLDNYNHVSRQLRWTSFRDGIPQGL